MKLTLLLLLFSYAAFGQNKIDKDYYQILSSPDALVIANGYGYSFRMPSPVLGKRQKDSLQAILDNWNTKTRDKEYVYYMKVYKDYSYDIEIEYRFHNNIDGSSGATISGEEYRRLPKN